MDEMMHHKNVITTEATSRDQRIGISADLYQKLKAVADQTGMTVEAIVAEAITDRIDELKKY